MCASRRTASAPPTFPIWPGSRRADRSVGDPEVNSFRGPEALRFGSQATGGVVEAINNRIPTAAPLGGWRRN